MEKIGLYEEQNFSEEIVKTQKLDSETLSGQTAFCPCVITSHLIFEAQFLTTNTLLCAPLFAQNVVGCMH